MKNVALIFIFFTPLMFSRPGLAQDLPSCEITPPTVGWTSCQPDPAAWFGGCFLFISTPYVEGPYPKEVSACIQPVRTLINELKDEAYYQARTLLGCQWFETDVQCAERVSGEKVTYVNGVVIGTANQALMLIGGAVQTAEALARAHLGCQPGESNEACAQRVALKDEIGLGLPSQSVSRTIPSQSVSQTIPSLTVPAQSIPGQATPNIPAQTVSTPTVPPQSVMSPAIPVPQICTPINILCVGPFTIPQQPLVTTPGVPSQSVTTPGVAPIPLTPPVTTPPVTTPAVTIAQTTPVITIAASTSGFEALVTPHVGDLSTIGPIFIFVPTPFGPFPVTVCASTCPVPVLPAAALDDASVTITLTVGDTIITRTVPVDFP